MIAMLFLSAARAMHCHARGTDVASGGSALGAPDTKPWIPARLAQELLMVALREWACVYGPLVLLFDDFCRADLLSWSLLARCAADASAAVVVAVAIRPDDGILAAFTSDKVGSSKP